MRLNGDLERMDSTVLGKHFNQSIQEKTPEASYSNILLISFLCSSCEMEIMQWIGITLNIIQRLKKLRGISNMCIGSYI